jgi:hypothetical protein
MRLALNDFHDTKALIFFGTCFYPVGTTPYTRRRFKMKQQMDQS